MADTEALDRALRNRQLRNSVRVVFEGISNDMVVRLMLTPTHEITGYVFLMCCIQRLNRFWGIRHAQLFRWG